MPGEALGLGSGDWPLPSGPSSAPSVASSVAWSLARSFFRPGSFEPAPADGDPVASGDEVEDTVGDTASGDAPSAPQPPRSRLATTPITATRTGLVFI